MQEFVIAADIPLRRPSEMRTVYDSIDRDLPCIGLNAPALIRVPSLNGSYPRAEHTAGFPFSKGTARRRGRR